MGFDVGISWENSPGEDFGSIWVQFNVEQDSSVHPNGYSNEDMGIIVAQAVANALEGILDDASIVPTQLKATYSYTSTDNISLS